MNRRGSATATDHLIDADRARGCARGDWRSRLAAALVQPVAEREALLGEARETGYHGYHGRTARRAGVLIAVVGASEPFIYFTQRSAALRRHPGQISFPGGRVDEADASVQAAALREAREEIGLDPANVTILGELPEYRTVTGFIISPFVGWVDVHACVTPDGVEVMRLFGVPLSHALDPGRFRREQMRRGGRDYTVYSIDYDGNHIWGATAGILYGLVQRLRIIESRANG